MVSTRKVLVAFCEISPQKFKLLSAINFAIKGEGRVIVETAGLDELRLSKLRKLLSLPDDEIRMIEDSELSIFTNSGIG